MQRALSETYVVERELGGGGMSRVFVARERQFDRMVVLKVLPAELHGLTALERFRREISVAARLQHAHIVPLLSAGDARGVPFFTMPLIEGESLRARLAGGAELPLAEAVRILREVASALAYAHEHGVVHRDIKPENVLLSGGAAMVSDFGVSKALSASTSESASGLTSVGLALGTPEYMSPEQASADPQVDHRADLYAWGVLAYELLTGSTPFGGRPPQAQLAAHVTEAAEHVTLRRPAAPAALAELVMQCLAKRPADRPQSASELLRVLDSFATPSGGAPFVRAWRGRSRWLYVGGAIGVVAALLTVTTVYRSKRSAAGSSDAVRTVAVLAAPTTEDSSQWFADGIAQTLEGRLLQLPGIEVHSSASLSATKARDLPPAEIGKRLRVASLLRVTVARSGATMRASIQLLRAADGRVEWASDPIVAPVRDMLVVQDTIAMRAVGALRIQLEAAGAARLVAHGSSVVAANEAFMRGELLRRRLDLVNALAHLKRAVALDPNFGQAHAALAQTYAFLPMSGLAGRDSAARLSRQSAERALALDSTLAGAHFARAILLYADYQFVAAEREMRRASKLNPTDVEGHAWLAFFLGQLGRTDESLAEARAAIQIDPLSESALLGLQVALYTMHRFDEALAVTRSLLDVDPGSTMALANLSEIYTFLGMSDSAVAVARRTLTTENSGQYGSRAYAMFAFAGAGQWAAVDSQRAIMARVGTNSPNYIATIDALVAGDADAAALSMESGIKAREPVFATLLIGCEPYFDLLKTNARYLAMLKRLGITPCPALPNWPIKPRPR